MPSQVWIDGRLVPKNDARISVFDHGLLFGDGAAEGMRVYDGQVFRLGEHLDRLAHSAAFLSLSLPLSRDELAAAVRETLLANNRSEGYVRVLVTRGAGTLGLDPRKCDPTVIVIAEEMVEYPRELYAAGLEVITYPTTAFLPGVTLLSRPSEVAAKAAAIRAGCLDALLYTLDGDTLLGSTDGSVFVVAHGTLQTHPGTQVAQRAVLEEVARAGVLPQTVAPLTRDTLFTADEVFLVSSATEVIPVVRVDRQPIGTGEPGPVTRRVQELYRAATRRPGEAEPPR